MLLSRSELEDLTQTYDQWHVSIYMPTYRAGDEIRQNAIRFKNLLNQAEEQLVEGGMRRPEAQELLSPGRALAEDEIFWQRRSDGLAVFLAEDMTRKYRLPLDFEDLLVVGGRFHVKPLLSVLSNNGRFYVLALSQHETRLLQGTRHRIGEIDLDDEERVPESIVEILKWEDPEKRLQAHTGTEAVIDGGVVVIFHGHGVASQDDPDDKILRYFQRLDLGVADLLADDDAPLVLAGDGFLLPLYREANSYPHLAQEGIAKQPDELSAEELHREAWSIVRSTFSQAQERAEETYHHLSGTESERVARDVEEVVRAAAFGRVEGLFVARDEQRWGAFDEETSAVELHEEQQPGDQDLLDVAAVQTMLHEGWLFVVDGQDVPRDDEQSGLGAREHSLAAVLRW